jgi:hypothetical protein
MTTHEERLLNKVAYGDGERKVDENHLTILDHGIPYRFDTGYAAHVLNAPKGMKPELGVAYRILGVSAKEE